MGQDEKGSGGWGSKLLDLVAPRGPVPGTQTNSGAVAPASTSATAPVISVPRRPSVPSGTIDPTMYAEVARALDEQVRSSILSAFLAQVEALSEDIPDALTRYRVALKTVATSQSIDRSMVLQEVSQAVGARVSTLENERRRGEQEFTNTEQASLTAATQRREVIRKRVGELRAEIGRLQEEETELDRHIENVQTQMGEARSKFSTACDKHATVLLDLQSKIKSIQ